MTHEILHKLTGLFLVVIAVAFFSMVLCYGTEIEVVAVMIPAILMGAVGIKQMTQRLH